MSAPNQLVHKTVTESEVFRILDRLRPTATGLDGVPAWFLRLGAAIFAAPIAYLFNQSVREGMYQGSGRRLPLRQCLKSASQYNQVTFGQYQSRMCSRGHLKDTSSSPTFTHHCLNLLQDFASQTSLPSGPVDRQLLPSFHSYIQC